MPDIHTCEVHATEDVLNAKLFNSIPSTIPKMADVQTSELDAKLA
jgi:hypothetical protein